jgi:hypothetical protein
VLQPGIDKLAGVDDFPKDAPILVITDGACDVLVIRREHAFFNAAGRSPAVQDRRATVPFRKQLRRRTGVPRPHHCDGCPRDNSWSKAS